MPFAIGPTAALVRKLTDRLVACSVGDHVTYPELSKAIGRSVTGRLYLMQRARDLANAEVGAIFQNVRGVGYARLANDAVCGVGQTARGRIRRIGKRASKHMTNVLVHANDVPEDIRLKAYSEQATLGLIGYMTFDRNMPKSAPGRAPPPTHETVRATVTALRETFNRRTG